MSENKELHDKREELLLTMVKAKTDSEFFYAKQALEDIDEVLFRSSEMTQEKMIKTLESFVNNGVHMKVELSRIVEMLKCMHRGEYDKAITWLGED